jgi:hypothetical protein
VIGRTRVPDEVRAVETAERRLAWGLTDDGVALVATASALHVGDQELPWWRVEKAAWQPPLLTVIEVAEVEGTGTRRAWSLAQDSRLAEVVHGSVTSSVAWSDYRKLPVGGRVRLVGRRVPERDPLEWQVVWQSAQAAADPALRALAASWVEALRTTIG